ncbi:DNA recombination protein RmuC [Candidatus Dojkabacteria bacterium]|jgi:DNA recombination protein RmuC|nr:DNA recombination protein RmuC [Candidatus Dojkabacteria bacterium]
MEIFLIVLVILLLGVVIYFLIRNNSSSKLEDAVKKSLPDLLTKTNEQLVLMANEKLSSEKKEIRADMESKRGEIERLIKTIKDDLKDNKEKLGEESKERVTMFSSLKTSLDEYKKITEQLSTSTEGLKKVLSNNQMRGQFGEQVADNLLKMAGFVIGKDYQFNKEQAGSETRPDFTIYLPDQTKINVDAKFPFANLQKSTETENKEEKKKYLNDFEQDVKTKIKQVIGRDYINPEDKTVDFVLLFIPNEMIFSYIYEKMQEVWEDALQKKVVFVGPFSFTALLRMIKQSYENFRVQQNIQQIVTHVRALEKEFGKFGEEFEKVGDRIESLTKQYNDVSRTRVNQMNKIMDKVKLEEGEKKEQPKLIE